MSRILTKQLLLSSNYWILNKTIVKLLGIETAFLLSNFAEAEQMMADKNGWFYQTAGTVEEMTTLSRHKQDQCIKQLEESGLIEKDVRGMPAKRYFRIDYDRLANLIVNNSQTRVEEIDKQDCKKSATNKESSYKESNKESNSSDSDFMELVRAFEQNGFGTISDIVRDHLVQLSEDYTSSWVLDAIKVAVGRNARNLRYVEGILKSWQANGKDDGLESKSGKPKLTEEEIRKRELIRQQVGERETPW